MWTDHRTWWLDTPHAEKPSARKTQYMRLGCHYHPLRNLTFVDQTGHPAPPTHTVVLIRVMGPLCAWVPTVSESVSRLTLPTARTCPRSGGPTPSLCAGWIFTFNFFGKLYPWESVRGCCPSILLKSNTSQTNSITGCAL